MIQYYPELVQGTEEWLSARCGLLTASEMHLIVTPATLRAAANDKERAHLYELLAQRVTGFVEPAYINDDMLRGMDDEIDARLRYAKTYAPVTEMGFITNDKWGFKLGYSPDGLVGDDGLIECKSRRQKLQMETLVERVSLDLPPAEYLIQIQTGMLVSEREWCDFISYCGGLHMITIRVYPDAKVQDAILHAARSFEERLARKLDQYHAVLESDARVLPTERRVQLEIVV